MSNAQRIYKVMSEKDWRRFQVDGIYQGSSDDIRDGFIHFSTSEQLETTLVKHFSGQTHLVILEVSTAALNHDLRWEPSRGGTLFPHLYSPLALTAVTQTVHVSDRVKLVSHHDGDTV